MISEMYSLSKVKTSLGFKGNKGKNVKVSNFEFLEYGFVVKIPLCVGGPLG